MYLSNSIEEFLSITKRDNSCLNNVQEVFTIKEDSNPLAFAALFYNKDIKYKNYKKIGQIGFFDSVNDKIITNYLFNSIKNYAKKNNYDFLIGPMEGSTYNKYRLKVSNNPSFLFDVDNKDYYPRLFKSEGFKVIGSYCSTLYKNLNRDYSRIEKFDKFFKNKGIVIKQLDLANFDCEIKRIFKVCKVSFTNNFLYSPISFNQFYNMYEPIKKIINPEFILIAENEKKEPAAFVFCYDDYLNKTAKTLVIKTLAQIPNPKYKGLGSYLVELIHKKAFSLGYNQIIHALMHDNNVSKNILKNGEIYQQYELLGVEL